MSDPPTLRHVPFAELELINEKVTKDGGDLRSLRGEDYGLVTSIYQSQIVPGSGPRRHRHPHAEIFVLKDGRARYEVEGASIDAVAGDIVIVPPNAWHRFENTGDTMLRQTAIHENARPAVEFEDGTRRD
jgi:quercetin dioxygenase-like cupin family protein